MRRKRIGSTVLCLALLLSLLPCSALAAAEPTLSVGSETYALQAGSCRTSESDTGYVRYFYSDGYFAAPPQEYNQHLATMSLNLAISAMNSSGSDYFLQHAPVRQLLADIGCADGTIRVNDEALVKPTQDSIAFTMGHKALTYADGTPTGAILLPLAVRGGGYELEWCSNFTIGEQGEAEGFASAADRVCAEVEQYLADFDLRSRAQSGQVKFWLVGYSRAAAVANLAAKRLVDQYGADAVYAYTWEAPMGGVESAEVPGIDYSGIHNIYNYADIIPLLAPSRMGFKRYGTDHEFPSANAGEYAQQVEAMKAQLAVLAPNATFDDSFSLGAMSMSSFMAGEPIYKVAYSHSSSNNRFTGDFLRLAVDKLQDWIITSRKKYATQPTRVGMAAYPTLQEAVTTLIPILEDVSTTQVSAIMEATEKLTSTPGFAVWIGNLYTKAIDWNKVTMIPAKKQACIDDCWAMFEASGVLTAFDAQTKEDLKRIWPTVACLIFSYISSDGNTMGSSLGYKGVEDKFVLTGTVANNMIVLAGNHVPQLTLAWARSFDSFYADETTPCGGEESGTLTAPVLLVSGGSASTVQDTPTAVRLGEAITLDVPTTRGEIICYTLAPIGGEDGARQLYRGDIRLPAEAETVYRITTYAIYDGETSATATYFLTNAPSCLFETEHTADGIVYCAECVGMGDGTARIVAAAYQEGQLTKTVCLDGPALSGGTVSGTIPLGSNDGNTLRVFFLDALGRPLTDAQ